VFATCLVIGCPIRFVMLAQDRQRHQPRATSEPPAAA
jgi:hypothetical protein